MSEKNNAPFLQTALKFGLIYGLVKIAFGMISQLMIDPREQNVMASLIVTAISLPVAALLVYILIMADKQQRDDFQAGQITMGKAFLIGLVAAVIGGIIASLFSYIYIKFIMDPNVISDMMDMKDDIVEQMEDQGTPDFFIKMASAGFAMYENPLRVIPVGIGSELVKGAIWSLIAAAIIKKDVSSNPLT